MYDPLSFFRYRVVTIIQNNVHTHAATMTEIIINMVATMGGTSAALMVYCVISSAADVWFRRCMS